MSDLFAAGFAVQAKISAPNTKVVRTRGYSSNDYLSEERLVRPETETTFGC